MRRSTEMPGWVVLGLLAAVFAALVAILGKVGVRDVDPVAATAIRAVVMAAVLVGVTVAFGKGHDLGSVGGRALTFVVLSGLAGAASWVAYFTALRHGPATGVAALDRLSIVFVLLLAVPFLGETFTWRAGAGAVLVVVGAILLL